MSATYSAIVLFVVFHYCHNNNISLLHTKENKHGGRMINFIKSIRLEIVGQMFVWLLTRNEVKGKIL